MITNENEWVTKAEAAALLGTSTRQLERRAENGNIRKRTAEKRPWERAATVLYARADIVALNAGNPNTHATLVSNGAAMERQNNGNSNGHPPAATEPTTRATSTPDTLATPATLATIPSAIEPPQLTSAWRQLAVDLGAALAAAPHQEQKFWLNIEEASRASGMPIRWLRAKAEAGWDVAENIGTGKAKFWRFNREGLRLKVR